jgi:hypothetical protein
MKVVAVAPGDAEALTASLHGDPISPDKVSLRTSDSAGLLGSSHFRSRMT